MIPIPREVCGGSQSKHKENLYSRHMAAREGRFFFRIAMRYPKEFDETLPSSIDRMLVSRYKSNLAEKRMITNKN